MTDASAPEGYNTSIPAKIMTPDRVDTRIGTLEFIDGFPTAATVCDALERSRTVGRNSDPELWDSQMARGMSLTDDDVFDIVRSLPVAAQNGAGPPKPRRPCDHCTSDGGGGRI